MGQIQAAEKSLGTANNLSPDETRAAIGLTT